MDYYQDKIALITGAASGIGRALSRAIARRGATVVCADIDLDGAKATVSLIKRDNGSAEAVGIDVTHESEVTRVVEEAAARHGRLDLMFNNAGIGIGGEFRDMTTDHWRRIVEVNLWGVIYGTTAAYRVMRRQRFGAIVNTASMAGLVPVPALTAYATTKHAVVGLSVSLAPEAADLGIRIHVVCPGGIDTPIFQKTPILGNGDWDALKKFPFLMDVDKAAEKILAGVRRKKAIIVFPRSSALVWYLYRLRPSSVFPFSLRMVREFRKARIGD
jgi:NAD(P)-dependent dehydrogenase (short-subunit alcohol dehydrogenase family)